MYICNYNYLHDKTKNSYSAKKNIKKKKSIFSNVKLKPYYMYIHVTMSILYNNREIVTAWG